MILERFDTTIISFPDVGAEVNGWGQHHYTLYSHLVEVIFYNYEVVAPGQLQFRAILRLREEHSDVAIHCAVESGYIHGV